ncbi:hypothetical protein B0T22DRAFT_436462 [Podospora appendiculata]|uniref:Uncharacterized protein n=1 Tax=Podospora appendiculata TaxID=314037 RepID=A0AAE1CGE7_9PEZI|nr:hypothetical protein B0T22DRAFT_436462 [Podospora appendiculata]
MADQPQPQPQPPPGGSPKLPDYDDSFADAEAGPPMSSINKTIDPELARRIEYQGRVAAAILPGDAAAALKSLDDIALGRLPKLPPAQPHGGHDLRPRHERSHQKADQGESSNRNLPGSRNVRDSETAGRSTNIDAPPERPKDVTNNASSVKYLDKFVTYQNNRIDEQSRQLSVMQADVNDLTDAVGQIKDSQIRMEALIQSLAKGKAAAVSPAPSSVNPDDSRDAARFYNQPASVPAPQKATVAGPSCFHPDKLPSGGRTSYKFSSKEMRKILGPNVGTGAPGDPDDPGSSSDGDFANDFDYRPERTPPDDSRRGRSVSPDPPQQNPLANAHDQNAAQDNSQFYDHSRQAADLRARVAALGRDDFIQYIHATRPPARNNPGNPGGNGSRPPPLSGGGNNNGGNNGGNNGRHDPDDPGRDARHPTVDSGRTGAFGGAGQPRIKHEDVGHFDPHFDDPQGLGLVQDGKNLVFTDVFCFKDRIDTFLEDEHTREEAQRQLLAQFQTLLAGPAVLWWNNELTPTDRRELRRCGLDAMMNALMDRFSPDSATATSKFIESELAIKDIAKDPSSLVQFIQKKTRWARATNLLAADNLNWYGVMHHIWSSMDLVIKQYLRAPKRSETLSQYMLLVDETRVVLTSAAYDRYPHLSPKRKDSSKDKDKEKDRDKTSSRRERSRSRRRDDSYRQSNRNNRSGYRNRRSDYRDRGRDDYRRNDRDAKETTRDKDKDKDKDGDKDRYRGNRDYRDYRDRGRDDRPRDRAHFAGEPQDDKADDAQSEASADSYGYSDDSDAGHAFIVLNRHLTCYKCHADFTTHSATRAHIRDCTPFKAVQTESVRPRSPADPSVRTCGFCNKLFDSRNKLFKHLKLCEDAKKGFFRPPEFEFGSSDESDSDESDEAAATNAFNTDHVEEHFARVADDFEVQIAPAQLLEEADSSPMSSYTHLRVQARASEKSANTEVCLDPGAGRSLVDSRFLKQLRHSVSPRRGRVKGIGDDVLRLTEWATFDLFLVGKNAAGKNSLLKITKSAWVVDSYLEANLLLGNDFMHPAKAEFRYEDCTAQFTAFDNFACEFAVLNRAVQCNRKVVSQHRSASRPSTMLQSTQSWTRKRPRS